MEPRERWLAVLNHEKPDRVPMDYRATAEASRRLRLRDLRREGPTERSAVPGAASIGARAVVVVLQGVGCRSMLVGCLAGAPVTRPGSPVGVGRSARQETQRALRPPEHREQ